MRSHFGTAAEKRRSCSLRRSGQPVALFDHARDALIYAMIAATALSGAQYLWRAAVGLGGERAPFFAFRAGGGSGGGGVWALPGTCCALCYLLVSKSPPTGQCPFCSHQ